MPIGDQSADLIMRSGDSRTLIVNVRDLQGVEVDITGIAIITYALARSLDDLPIEILISKSLAGGGITKLPFDAITNPNSSRYAIKLLAADTEPLIGNYYHESKIIDPVGDESTTFTSDNVEFCKNLN